MSSEAFEKWTPEAAKIEKPRTISVPQDVLIGESTDLAAYITKYWEPTENRPGLSSAREDHLPPSLPDEIIELGSAARHAQLLYQQAIERRESFGDQMDRARFILNEVTAVLEWHLDDGVHDTADEDLANLDAAHANDDRSADATAQALYDYCTFAKPMAADLDGLGGFDAAIIDEGLELAETLRQVTSAPTSQSVEAQEALQTRNQLVHLLYGRMRAARAAARFVFRNHPAIAREATSAYERRRRAERGRAVAAPA